MLVKFRGLWGAQTVGILSGAGHPVDWMSILDHPLQHPTMPASQCSPRTSSQISTGTGANWAQFLSMYHVNQQPEISPVHPTCPYRDSPTTMRISPQLLLSLLWVQTQRTEEKLGGQKGAPRNCAVWCSSHSSSNVLAFKRTAAADLQQQQIHRSVQASIQRLALCAASDPGSSSVTVNQQSKQRLMHSKA